MPARYWSNSSSKAEHRAVSPLGQQCVN
jgi:hypothetical protein